MEEVMYKPFHETYKILTFMLSIGMMYPNPERDRSRLVMIILILLSSTPFVCLVLIDVQESSVLGDTPNIIRHITVAAPFVFILFKMTQIYFKRVQSKELMDEINRDYASYNNFNEEYQSMISARIRNNRNYCERLWAMSIFSGVMSFPLRAAVLTFYNHVFKFEPLRYSVHDINMPNSNPEKKFESPYYEIMFIYMLYTDILDIVNFIGFDGYFGVCINHACMKIEIIWKLLDVALKTEDPKKALAEVIKEQQKLFRFVDIIQDTFSIWLGAIYIITIIEVCTCLYMIVEGYGMDIRYLITVVVTTIHIYLPCRYTAKLKAMSLETANVIYCSGWENITDIGIRKIILLMITRSQIPLEIKGLKIITYDMQLFTSIMQASYSMYTLLKST